MQILNIAGYKFIALSDLNELKNSLQKIGILHSLKGTILLSEEGININLSGFATEMQAFLAYLQADMRFADIKFHEMYSNAFTFQRLKIKLKKEIITLKQSEADVLKKRAPSIAPDVLKQWLDENRNITLLDTRNDFEVAYGTFNNATNLDLQQFSELPSAINEIDRHKPIVMFCTGGIRCEKAALYMMNQGFSEVYQLDGGILGYFAKVGGEHYSGSCFVFDERVAVLPDSFT